MDPIVVLLLVKDKVFINIPYMAFNRTFSQCTYLIKGR